MEIVNIKVTRVFLSQGERDWEGRQEHSTIWLTFSKRDEESDMLIFK